MFRLDAVNRNALLVGRVDVPYSIPGLNPLIFYGMLVVIAVAAIPFGTVEPWWVAAFEVSVFALASLGAIEFCFSSSTTISTGKYVLLWPLMGIVILAGVQILRLENTARSISFDPHETDRFIFKFVALILTGSLLLSHIQTRSRLRALVNVVITIGALSGLFGLIRATTSGINIVNEEATTGFAQFINRNHFAFLAEMSFGLALGLLVGGKLRRQPFVMYSLAVVIIWVAIIASLSRGGLFSMMSQVGFMLLLIGSKRMQQFSEASKHHGARHSWLLRLALGAGVMIAIFVAVIWIGGEPLSQRLQQETMTRELHASAGQPTSRIRRIDIWRATVRMVNDHPIVGVGFGGYWLAIPQYLSYSGKREVHQAHNDYLEILASGGVIGGALVACFAWLLIRRARRHFFSSDPLRRAACLGALTGIFGVAVHSVFDFGLHVTINALVFVSLVVIATAELRKKQENSVVRAE